MSSPGDLNVFLSVVRVLQTVNGEECGVLTCSSRRTELGVGDQTWPKTDSAGVS